MSYLYSLSVLIKLNCPCTVKYGFKYGNLTPLKKIDKYT